MVFLNLPPLLLPHQWGMCWNPRALAPHVVAAQEIPSVPPTDLLEILLLLEALLVPRGCAVPRESPQVSLGE